MLRYACKSLKPLCVSRAIAGALLIEYNSKALNILVMDSSQASLILVPNLTGRHKLDAPLHRSWHGTHKNVLLDLTFVT